MWITYKQGRDAVTGWFLSVKAAMRRKKTAVVETVRYQRKKKK